MSNRMPPEVFIGRIEIEGRESCGEAIHYNARRREREAILAGRRHLEIKHFTGGSRLAAHSRHPVSGKALSRRSHTTGRIGGQKCLISKSVAVAARVFVRRKSDRRSPRARRSSDRICDQREAAARFGGLAAGRFFCRLVQSGPSFVCRGPRCCNPPGGREPPPNRVPIDDGKPDNFVAEIRRTGPQSRAERGCSSVGRATDF